MLFDKLELSHNVVLQCTGDADTVIVSKVLDYACAGNSLKLIGADIELQIMLLYFWNSEMAEITMLSELTKKNEDIVYNISRITVSISDIRKHITFANSFGGFDTALVIHGLDKVYLLRLLVKSAYARKLADVLICPFRTKDNIKEAGRKLVVVNGATQCLF